MSRPDLGTGHELGEARALELIFEDSALKCRGSNGDACPNEAIYQVTCSCFEGFTHQCAECIATLRKEFALHGLELGFFGKYGCGHVVDFLDCTIRPI